MARFGRLLLIYLFHAFLEIHPRRQRQDDKLKVLSCLRKQNKFNVITYKYFQRTNASYTS